MTGPLRRERIIRPRAWGRTRVLIAVALLVALAPRPALAYIGPGAGFALAGSFFAVFAALVSAVFTILTWPARLLVRLVFGWRAMRRARARRVVVLGLDGMDHGLTGDMLERGELPNFAALRARGCFRPLGSTVPPISPVAWSTFLTGVNPGKHNIFDFLTPDRHGYHAKMSSVEIRPPRRFLRLGKYRVPLGKAVVRLLRKSQPFWNVLGRHGISSCIIRVPITFPPEKLRGALLSAMCAPDLRGTQGMFSQYTSRPPAEGERIGGEAHHVAIEGRTRDGGYTVRARLVGPPDPWREKAENLELPFTVTVSGGGKDGATAAPRAVLAIDGKRYELKLNEYTDWITVRFRAGPFMKVSGICKFLLREASPEFALYVTPINIDPERPAMPVGWPSVYSVYLAKKQGPFATLGLAEDTWALNEGVITDEQFIQQCVDMDNEREAMFFDALDKVPRGLIACVFDGTDRLQHTFWRDIDPDHPARPCDEVLKHRDVVADLYKRMDRLVGETMKRCRDRHTLLMVISDHGFGPFRRGVDLNRWLEQNGYLALLPGRGHEDHLASVDWSRTRAFAIGLAGIYLNIRDKYANGIVSPGAEAEALRAELSERLTGLVDPKTGASAVKRVYTAARFYKGPYRENGPDLIVGYERGYRVSWETAIGRATDEVFQDNLKAWSGDHCVDPSLVPGILFCNRVIENQAPRLIDIAPTVLSIFGVSVPDYMDGKALSVGDHGERPRPAAPRSARLMEASHG